MHPSTVPSRVTLDIDLGILRDNYRRIAEASAPCGIIAVLKADAYGLGMGNVIRGLEGCAIAAIAVAELSEGLAALELGLDVPVLVLGGLLPDEVEPCIKAGLRVPAPSVEAARILDAAAARLGRTATVHIPLDTGMGRVGFRADDPDTPARIAEVAALPHLHLEGMYSHFPMAQKSSADFTLGQIALYRRVAAAVEALGVPIPWKHIANSDAINNFPAAVQPPFTHVRAGLDLHGPFAPGGHDLGLRSVLSMHARLAQVRDLPAGATIGYSATYRTPVPMRVGTVAAGYADGLPLALSNRGHVLIRGRACPVLGRVCMDYVNVSLVQVPDAACGDEVILLGGNGPGAISVEDWATLKGTHAHEVLCSIGQRVRRRVCG